MDLVANVLAEDGVTLVNRIVLKDTDNPADFNAVWDDDHNTFVKSQNYREIRNKMLDDSDWMAMSDRVMTQDQRDYRQALRDVPQQSGFPNLIDWPVEP